MTPGLVKRIIGLAIVGFGIIVLFFHGIGSIFTSVQAFFTPVSQPASFTSESYKQLLKTFVKDGYVDYKGLKQSPLLKQSVDELARVSPAKMLESKAQLSFWINTSNLLTLKLICDRYPITDIQQLGNAKNGKKFLIGGQPMSVQDIYVDKILPLLKTTNAKYIFLLCGGSQGYPILMDRAFEAGQIETDMEVGAYTFVTNPKNVKFDEMQITLFVSPFMQWHAALFEEQYGSPFAFVLTYMKQHVRDELTRASANKSFGMRFDWTLNDVLLKKKTSDKNTED